MVKATLLLAVALVGHVIVTGANAPPVAWFNNVELVVAEKVGMETTTYVRNIDKYYVSYKLTLEAQEAAGRAREALAGKPGQ